MTCKELPIGIQTFREIREDGDCYVDKTGQILVLIEEGKYCSLSRQPARAASARACCWSPTSPACTAGSLPASPAFA